MSIGYKGTITDFLADPNKVMTDLAKTGANYCVLATQSQSWSSEIDMLKEILGPLGEQKDGRIFFEYEIPRMNKRIDVVLLLSGIIFVLEYKISRQNKDHYASADCEQVIDYAMELSYFHSKSHSCPIVPILIDTGVAKCPANAFVVMEHNIYNVLQCNDKNSLKDLLERAIRELPKANRLTCHETWEDGIYEPTPTIVEAAEYLYANHSVDEITRSGAGAEGIKKVTTKINEIIDDARTNSKKVICFLTGVPGAGKTLVGINIAAKRDASHSNRVFLRCSNKYSCNASNWGDCKGLTFGNVCVVLNEKTYTLFCSGKLNSLTPISMNKFYVACTRASGQLFFIREKDVSEYKTI